MWRIDHSKDFEVYSFANVYVKDLLKWSYENKTKFQDINAIANWSKKKQPNDLDFIKRIKKISRSRKTVRSHMHTLHNYDKKKIAEIINLHNYLGENYTKILKEESDRISFLDEETNKELNEIFKYAYEEMLYNKSFWKAYGMTKTVSNEEIRTRISSKIKICPYCDKSTTSLTEVHVDHFLPKSKFPLLSIHWRNFVLACNTCNDTLNKGEKWYLPVLHPFFDEINKKLKFEFFPESQTVDIRPVFRTGLQNLRTENFIKLLNLRERYQGVWPFFFQSTLEEFIKIELHTYSRYKDDYNRDLWIKSYAGVIQKNKNKLKEHIGKDTMIKLKLDYCDHVEKNDQSYWSQHLKVLIQKRKEMVNEMGEEF
ncbi:HNH endonuclease [Bacillus cereus group sp. BfR-BA-01352]|uniref:HNH endonuclease n=1 Tax=Bacillus cereus group sp. BfR-BA-01352 TaxID=2920315 RepID=UPI001F585C45|nr:HNH endonuclease [Bacillus cereus group sp. BfR-BA-01352]